MDTEPQALQEYLTPDGKNPFRKWLHALRDVRARAKVRIRLNRVRLGNFGDAKAVGGGVLELRIPYGPGYRVYFAGQAAQLCCFFAAETNHHKSVISKKQRNIGWITNGETHENIICEL